MIHLLQSTVLWGITFALAGFQLAFAQSATINLTSEKQYIRGFGGMNCPGWIPDLTAAQADKAFGDGTGQIGLSMLRMRISHNSSEFSREVPTAVRAKSHGALLFASPWTPPANMKSNNNIVGGYLNTSSYAAYAAHLKAFCDYMSTNNATLYAVSIQNEPDIDVSYESCDWTSAQFISFLNNNRSAIGSIKVMVAESFQFRRPLTDAILNDATAVTKFDIIAGHIYGGGLSDYPLARNKSKEVWMTEHYSDTDSANIWSGALKMGKELHDCMVANFNAYVWWYIRRFYGLIDDNGNVTKRGYVMSQFSKFIRPGYTRVDVPASPATNVDVTAYKNGADVVVVVLNRNTASRSQQFTLQGGSAASFTKYTTSASKNVTNDGTVNVTGGSFTVQLDASSITTLVGTGTTGTIHPRRSAQPSRISCTSDGDALVIHTNGVFHYAVFDISGRSVTTGNARETAIIRDVLTRGVYVVKIRDSKAAWTMQAIRQ
ncbi:MAG: glucuronoxylanase [Chitinispirillaceae bacterium]|nr:glucuronoxylanase [Chitinispirillaceae bacterium]